MVSKFLEVSETPGAAIFMSGSGSNAEKLLESLKKTNKQTWNPKVLVTDAPKKSRTAEIANRFDLPCVELDIREFYKQRGEPRMTLRTELGRKIREEWTNELRKLIEPFHVDFGILAGFVPLTNITGDFPCLNIHPGDLTVEKDGQRLLVGLHTIPIELAILAGHDSLRSSVIIAQSYTGSGGEMDTGPILGISPPVKIDLLGHSLEELEELNKQRPEIRPIGGHKDLLEDIAKQNLQNLKENGDWVVFPGAVADFAAGKFGYEHEDNQLYYKTGNDWQKIRTVVYNEDDYEIMI